MTKVRSITGLLATMLILVCILLPTSVVLAQDSPPPPRTDESWTPPAGGGGSFMKPGAELKFDSSATPSPSYGTQGSASQTELGIQSVSPYYRPPYGTTPSIMSANFIDGTGQIRNQFQKESFYLRIQVNTPGLFYLAEYFPPDSGMSPQWLIYSYQLDRIGTWVLGPFYPETYEPVGEHTWRMWLYYSGLWTQRTASFNFRPYVEPYPYPNTYPIEAQVSVAEPASWGLWQIVIVMVLVGALGITIGMLISTRRSTVAR
jgi:hypothetical protein